MVNRGAFTCMNSRMNVEPSVAVSCIFNKFAKIEEHRFLSVTTDPCCVEGRGSDET